ncbi:MAG: hypothetical protein LBJ83_00195 [Oscillospiraceae bacterium]|nr:hypothetical protein [Oscillospiraceae bacterium]
MLKTKHIVIFSVFITIITGVRCFFVSAFVNPQTGFYGVENIWTTIFNLSLLIIGSVGAVFVLFYSTNDDSSVEIKFSKKWGIIFAIVSVLFGVFFLYDFLKHKEQIVGFLPSGIANVSFQLFPGSSMGTIRQYFGLVSGIVFIIQGVLFLMGQHAMLKTNLMKLVQVLPILWAIAKVMQVLDAYVTIYYISEHIIAIFALVFIMRALYSQATLLAFNTNTRGFVKTHIVASLLAIFFSCLVVVPFYIFPAFGNFHGSEFYYGTINAFILFAALYVCGFLISFSLERGA